MSNKQRDFSDGMARSCDEVFVDGDKLRMMVYFQKRYLPKDVSLSMINEQVVVNYPKAYLEIVKDCYELALFLVKREKSFGQIERAVDNYFSYRVNLSLQRDPKCRNFLKRES